MYLPGIDSFVADQMLSSLFGHCSCISLMLDAVSERGALVQ